MKVFKAALFSTRVVWGSRDALWNARFPRLAGLMFEKKTLFCCLNTWFRSSVVGLGFLLLHLGVDASSPLNFGGELLDGKPEMRFSCSMHVVSLYV